MILMSLMILIILKILIILVILVILISLISLVILMRYLSFCYTDILLLRIIMVIMQIGEYLSYGRQRTLFIERRIENVRYLLKVGIFESLLTNFDFVKISLMYTSLASLPESFLAAINFANKRFFSSVRVRVFYQILLQSKLFFALRTFELFVCFMLFHVALQAILSFKLVFAIYDVAHE